MGHAPTHKRIKQISISKPIAYGNTAEKFSAEKPKPPSSPEDHTHHWTIFVKDPLGNDLTTYIKKVVFKLHDTYPNSTRSIETPPFEVTETGWGEFEIVIKIFFQSEGGEKNVTLLHHLKLHPFPATVVQEDGSIKSVLYDEIVFNEPTEKMFALLTKTPGTLLTNDLKKREREELDRIAKSLKDVRETYEKESIEFKELETERQKLMEL